MAKRFVVECTWSGYRSSQSRVCHRTVIDKYKAQRLSVVHTVGFTDGTSMSVVVRPCTPREKVKQLKGYVSLLDKIAWSNLEGFVSVMDVN